MEWTADIARGDWIGPRLQGWGRVGGVAPRGFEAYARVLHPASGTLFFDDADGRLLEVRDEKRMSWAEVARRQGRVMHPLVQWNRLAGGVEAGIEWDDGSRASAPQTGFFEPELLASLVPALRASTTAADDLTLGVWVGYPAVGGGTVTVALGFQGPVPDHPFTAAELAELESRRAEAERRARREREAATSPLVRTAVAHGPLLDLPGRQYVLLRGSLDELADPAWPLTAGIGWRAPFAGAMPQLIWPADRAWLIASEIDWDSTIVAGSRALVDAVLANPAIEAFEVQPDDALTHDGDTVNPPPGQQVT